MAAVSAMRRRCSGRWDSSSPSSSALTGVLLAVPPADFQLHNSLFLVAHFHNVIIGGVLFAGFAKAFGFRLHEGWGKVAFWCALIGFYVTFVPLYIAGLLGMTRRLQHYDVAAW